MINKIIKNQKGVTLLELTVAVGIFSVIILSAMQIFNLALEGQRNALAGQNIQESMRYAMEVISKEIRMAQKVVSGQCSSFSMEGEVYKTNSPTNSELYFKNYKNECVKYFVNSGRLKIERGADSDFITPDEVIISDINFEVFNDAGQQPRVTVVLDVEARGKAMHKQKIKIQTTISSRYYE